MQLLEHQGKALFRKYGIPVPEGRLAQDAEEAGLIASSLGVRVAVKAQVLAGGRGKAGGILLAEGYEEAKAAAAKIIGMRIKGITVREVLVEGRSARPRSTTSALRWTGPGRLWRYCSAGLAEST